MQYTKIRLDFKYGPKNRFYRVILIKGNPDLFKLSVELGTAVGAAFEHCFLITCKRREVHYVMAPFMEEPLDGYKYLRNYHLNDLPDSFKIEITSGYRTMQEHERIYAAEHPGQKIPYHSAHLTAQALDIKDPNGILKKAIWKNKNVVAKIMEKEGLSFESFNITNGWVHIQTKPLAAHGNQMWNFEDFQNARYQPMQ